MKIRNVKTFVTLTVLMLVCPSFATSFAKGRSISVRLFDQHELKTLEVMFPGQNNKFFRVSLAKKNIHVVSNNDSSLQDSLEIPNPKGLDLTLRANHKIVRRSNGPLQIRIQNQHLLVLSKVPLEDYVAGVLAAEMPLEFRLPALKAQAVIIRTRASNLSQPAHQGFNFCDSTHCQVFRKLNRLPEKIKLAVTQTRGQILSYRGKAIQALYHSTCGGHTSPNQRVFGGIALPYLQGVSDQNYCKDSPHYEWEFSLKSDKLARSLNSQDEPHKYQNIQRVEINQHDKAGRVFTLNLLGRNKIEISAENFRLQLGRHLGWNTLKSTLFTLQQTEEQIQFNGKGLGHGVGLCQWGANGMATAGNSYQSILLHYFPNTRLLRSKDKTMVRPNQARPPLGRLPN